MTSTLELLKDQPLAETVMAAWPAATVTQPQRIGSVESGVRARVRAVVANGYWLGGPGFVRPVYANLEIDRDNVVALEATTGIFGVGPTLADAVTDLRAALAEHRDVLRSEDKLSEELSAQLQFLRTHLA